MSGPVSVYCIIEVESESPLVFQAFKIGISRNPKARLRQLRTSNYHYLHLLMADAYRNRAEALEAEVSIHRYLQRGNITGEWFYYNDGQHCPFEAMAVAPKSRPIRSDLYYGVSDGPAGALTIAECGDG